MPVARSLPSCGWRGSAPSLSGLRFRGLSPDRIPEWVLEEPPDALLEFPSEVFSPAAPVSGLVPGPSSYVLSAPLPVGVRCLAPWSIEPQRNRHGRFRLPTSLGFATASCEGVAEVVVRSTPNSQRSPAGDQEIVAASVPRTSRRISAPDAPKQRLDP